MDEKNPSSRIDDFEETKKNKIKEILSIAREENVIAMLQPGDFLNKPKVSNHYLSQIKEDWEFNSGNIENLLIDVLLKSKEGNDLLKALSNCKRIPIIGTIGNHELIGGSLKTFDDCSIKQLSECGFIKLVDKDNPLILKDYDGTTVAITGSPYTLDIDGEDKSAYIVDEKLADVHIHLVHGMLMSKNFGEKFEHTTVPEILLKTKADLTLSGHDHIGYNPIVMDNKIAYNPGSPLRLSAENKEIERNPKVVIVEIKDKKITLKDIYLKSAKDGKEVLSRKHIEKVRAKNMKVLEMKSIVNKANLESSIDITDILKNIAKNKKLPEIVTKEAVELILDEMKKEEPFNPVGEYYITSLELINFESHAKSFFEFGKGLNVLTGQSTHGKSSVIRALSEVYLGTSKQGKGKGTSKRSIRAGENFFKIILTTSNGYEITRIFENKPKGKNKNGWEIYNPTSGTIEYVNTRGLKKVQEILGFNNIVLSDKNSVGINFLNQGQSWFFIGDNMTAPDRAKLLGVPFGSQYADSVLKNVNSKSKKISAEINFLDNEINKLDENINEFKYLEDLNKTYTKSLELKTSIENLLKDIEKLEFLIEKRNNIEESISRFRNIISIIKKNELDAKSKLEDAKSSLDEINKLELLINNRKEALTRGKEILYVLKSLSEISKLNESIKEYKKEYEDVIEEWKNLNSAKKLNKEKIEILKKGNLLKSIINDLNLDKTSEVKEIISFNEKIVEEEKKLKEIKVILNKKSLIENKINTLEFIINSFKECLSKDSLKDINDSFDNINKIEALIKNKNDIKDRANKEIKIINNSNKIKGELILKLESKLKNIGVCPVCQSKIDNNHINQILNSYK